MSPSIEGLMVCAVLLLLGYALHSPLIVALLASMALTATAFAVLPSLGGASPQIYTLFALILIAGLFIERGKLRMLAAAIGRYPESIIVIMLVLNTAGGAFILPRLFRDATSAFVPGRLEGSVQEVPLGPVPGNITQTSYFILGALTFLALCVAFRERGALMAAKRGFFAWICLNGALGITDVLGKTAGAGDVLAPIRTASYAMATEVEQAGFFRIAGGHSEASTFGAIMFVGLVFAASYWQVVQRRWCFIIMLVALVLVVLSTSTTAYACLGAYVGWLGISAAWNLMRGRFRRSDLILAGVVLTGFTVLLGIILIDASTLAGFERLIEISILNKAQSASAVERGYWNSRSLETVLETFGLGIGMGSSRSSNWFIAVLSQTGVLGALLQMALALTLLRPLPRATAADAELIGLHEAARSAGLASLLAASIAGGSADPGMIFFVCLATTLGCRALLKETPAAAANNARTAPRGKMQGQDRGDGETSQPQHPPLPPPRMRLATARRPLPEAPARP